MIKCDNCGEKITLETIKCPNCNSVNQIAEEHLIKGKLYLPIPSVVENPTTENLLFYALNCGNMFISIHDCVIMNKKNIEYQPEHVKCYNINLNIVHSCQIVDDDF